MRNGWTGGQYSLYRALFGGYLFVHYCSLVLWGPELFSRSGVIPNPWDSPLAALFPNMLTIWDSGLVVQLLLLAAAGLSISFAAGLWDRSAAVFLWYLGTCLFDRNPLIANPALPYVGWLLLAHVFLPAAPYGSLSARRDDDNGTRWRMRPEIYAIAWILLAVGYSYSGISKLSSPSWLDGSALARILMSPLARPGLVNRALLHLPPGFLRCATWGALAMEISFAPLSLFRRVRPWIWGGMLTVHLALLLLVSFPDLTVGMLMIHLFTFDPSWVPALQPGVIEGIFYDGECGLCHWAVRLVMAEDISGERFRFAPLGGGAFYALIPARRRAALPDSLVVLTAGGRVLARSAAIIHILGRLGGAWTCLAAMLAMVPRRPADAAYSFVARNRFRVFLLRTGVCPLVPVNLRVRLDSFDRTSYDALRS